MLVSKLTIFLKNCLQIFKTAHPQYLLKREMQTSAWGFLSVLGEFSFAGTFLAEVGGFFAVDDFA